ncbi:uncharacterized protein LOC116928587 isoform X2 [Daphnia magna]|nr:uncharacterized protein LOC116928587 isoform X2 [Daphnia magna]XP_032791595.2 uncharacterized protein LOC116928587 isoform X2 [Daphnia magna]XP_032791601.2 uncharacterized protein LOC116928587 isoform X2 [Daphnia magna]
MHVIVMTLLVSCAISPVLVQSDDIIIDDDASLRSSILNDIHAYNASCFPKDTCRTDKVSRISDSPDWTKRNCLCDDSCIDFGDCCPDSKRYEPNQQRLAGTRFSCLHLRQYNFNWIVNKCPENWSDPNVAKACETEPSEWQIHLDPISHMPVTSQVSGITYRNLNCAMCHQDVPGSRGNPSSLRFWNPRLECNSILAGSTILQSMTKDDLASKIQWDNEQKMWGLVVDINGKGEQFHSCFVDPALPDDLQSYLRPCQPSVNDCPPDWMDDDIRNKCLSYTSFVYRPQEIYRNIHCAICNSAQLQELSCNSSGISFRKLPDSREFNPSAFALLFDLKDNDGSGIVGQAKSCEDGQLYDPFSRKCRTVYCSQPGTVYREGRCLQAPSSGAAPATTSISIADGNQPETDGDAIVFPEHPNMGGSNGQYTDGRPDVSVTQLPELPFTVVDSSSTGSSVTDSEAVQPTLTNFTSIHPVNMTDKTQMSAEGNFTSCPKFLLSEDEVQWLDNGTLYVPSHGKPYDEGDYEKDKSGGGVWICAEGLTMVSKFDPILGWVTVAGLGLSEICLALHLIAFVISPDLRNLSGRNLASLSLALFAAYGSFIAAQFVPTGGNICIGIALSTFYFFLSAFWWTSVLAWDVWRTIRLATVQLRCSSSGQQWGKFILYSMYAWLLPALIVAAAVVVEYVDTDIFSWMPTEYRPFFGRNVCWFGQRKAILIYFAAPLAVILSINLLLFINSAHMIRSTTAKSPTSSNQASSRKQLGLYVRLALIMGLSWLAGLIAGAADFMPLWYVFVALCSLQGVFILLAYTCNPKVARSIRNRVLVCRKTNSRQSTYRTALVGGFKSQDLKRLGKGGKGKVEARDSHDSQVSQTSQTSLTKTTSNTTTP